MIIKKIALVLLMSIPLVSCGNEEQVLTQIPPSAETLISDARGFGALKIILKAPGIRDELNLDADSLDRLNVLYDDCVMRLRKSFTTPGFGGRRHAVHQLDIYVEPQLEQILGKPSFTSFSRFVIQQRVQRLPTSLLFKDGIVEYLGRPTEDREILSKKSSAYFNQQDGAPAARKEAFLSIADECSVEVKARLRELVGSGWLPIDPNISPSSTPEAPILEIALTWTAVLQVCSPKFATAELGAKPETVEQLARLSTTLNQAQEEIFRDIRVEYQKSGRQPDSGALFEKQNAEAKAGIQKILDKQQLVRLSQYRARSVIMASLSRFFAMPDVAAYLDDSELVVSLVERAKTVDLKVDSAMQQWMNKLYGEYVENLDLTSREKLSHLIELPD